MFENNQKDSNECKEINPVGGGGARQGAGRRKGTASKKTREIADNCAETGETPLEYMLRIMRTACRGNAVAFETITFSCEHGWGHSQRGGFPLPFSRQPKPRTRRRMAGERPQPRLQIVTRRLTRVVARTCRLLQSAVDAAQREVAAAHAGLLRHLDITKKELGAYWGEMKRYRDKAVITIRHAAKSHGTRCSKSPCIPPPTTTNGSSRPSRPSLELSSNPRSLMPISRSTWITRVWFPKVRFRRRMTSPSLWTHLNRGRSAS